MNLENLLTETRNPRTLAIDSQSSLDMVELINQEDQQVAAAVQTILPDIATAVDWIVAAIQSGGRLFYLGAGTSGRLGVLDAAECPPTYGTNPDLIIGLIAGGPQAMFSAVEGAEDSLTLAAQNLQDRSLQPSDIVLGIAASGRTPYVIGGLRYARLQGCRTLSLSCTANSEIGKNSDLSLTVLTGPEVIMGSTRMKAGTAQKMILNMLTTATMISLGKVYSNLMVDVQATNKKLQERSRRIVALATNANWDQVDTALTQAHGSAKLAIVMLLTNSSQAAAAQLLEQSHGFVAEAITLHNK